MTARQIHRFSAVATPWGNSCHVVVPRGWKSRRVYCLLQDEYNVVRDQMHGLKVEIIEVDEKQK
jgi:hypothetical protein